MLGASEGRLDEPRARAAAQLCIAAGADESMIPQWIQEGRRRAELRRHPAPDGPATFPTGWFKTQDAACQWLAAA